MKESYIFDVQDFAVKDGAGIRTLVFLKGCPLRCLWCSNPESQKYCREVIYIKNLCRKCHLCIASCPVRAIECDKAGGVVFRDRAACDVCDRMACADACPENAIKVAGRRWTIEALYKKIEANSLFYRNSGGGVTLSGGEPLMHPKFVSELLERLLRSGISAGLETCGYFDWEKAAGFIGSFDFIYYDIKCLDSLRHLEVTGVSNEKILDNFARLAGIMPSKLTVSVPVVPNVNVGAEDIVKIAAFIKSKGVVRMRLLPYHSLGASKYESLGREYRIGGGLEDRLFDLVPVIDAIKKTGVDCWVE